MRITGHIDRIDQELIEGWVLDQDEPSRRVLLDVLAGDAPLGQCTADRFREDLQQAGIGDGHCAFSFAPPPFVAKQSLAQLRFRLTGSDAFFVPPNLAAGKRAAISPDPAPTPGLGELWIDKSGWLDELARLHREGKVSSKLSVRIFEFIRDGFVIFPGAVPQTLLRALNADIESIWRTRLSGAPIESFEPEDKLQYVVPGVQYPASGPKLLDAYAFSRAAREAIANAPVLEFLSAIFADRPKAFQGLASWKGSQQAIHKDTAYVKIGFKPMALAATWLALEDISSGTGELEYFVGSHRAAPYLFGGASKWMEGHEAEHEAFLESLHADAQQLGHVRHSFLANAGDVLIWHADLAHGNSPICDPQATRKSLVTHFCPAQNEPFYRRITRFAPLETPACVFVSQYHDVE